MRNSLFVLVFIILLVPEALLAQQVLEGKFEGAPFTLNPREAYLKISTSNIRVPNLQDRSLIERFFVKRADYVLCTVKLYSSSDSDNAITAIPFSLEKDGSQYIVSTINPSGEYLLTKQLVFPTSGSLHLEIMFKAWQGEENKSYAKTIFQSASSIAELTIPYAAYIETALNLVDAFSPPEVSQSTVIDNIPLERLASRTYRITAVKGNDATHLFDLTFDSQESFFGSCDFSPVNELDFLKNDVSTWEEIVQNAAQESLDAQTPEAIRPILAAFSKFIFAKPLTEKDKAYFAAGALHNWAKSSTDPTCIHPGCISAGLFQEMPVGKLNYIRAREDKCWDLSGVDCTTESCDALSDFVRKSKTEAARQEAFDYISGEFSIYLDDKLLARLTPEKYLTDFAIKRVSKFKPAGSGGSIEYTFPFKGLEILLKTEGQTEEFMSYRMYTAVITQSYENKKYIIDSIDLISPPVN